MAGDAAISLAQPVSSPHTTSPYANTTTARENQVAIDDFAPGAVRESVAHIERATATEDGNDQYPSVPLSVLDFGQPFQFKPLTLPSPYQLASATETNPQAQVHPTIYDDRPTSELPHATLPIFQQGAKNAQSESIPKKMKQWWKLSTMRCWWKKRASKKTSADVSDENPTDDSKESSGLDGDDKGLPGDSKGSSIARGKDRKSPASMERRRRDDYYNIQPNQQQSSWTVLHSSNRSRYSYSDLPTAQPFIGADYSSQSRTSPPHSIPSLASVGPSRVSSPNLRQYILDPDYSVHLKTPPPSYLPQPVVGPSRVSSPKFSIMDSMFEDQESSPHIGAKMLRKFSLKRVG